MFSKKFVRRLLWSLTFVFIIVNFIAIFHAYKLTHFTDKKITRTKNPEFLTAGQKVSALVFGIDNPRPVDTELPATEFETIYLGAKDKIECWKMQAVNSKGTIALFHGYGGHMSAMLDRAYVFNRIGYNVLLVNFSGSGNSAGNQTTIGYYEADQVKRCFDYLEAQGEKNIYLMGTSMGAVAIMKAMNDFSLNAKGILLECPFGSMYQTVCARFRIMNAPTFPFAGLLMFWGSVENGFWTFGHNPDEYAKKINCPTLLMYGAKDQRVGMDEIQQIFNNLNGIKELKIFQNSGHESYLNDHKKEWISDVETFLRAHIQ